MPLSPIQTVHQDATRSTWILFCTLLDLYSAYMCIRPMQAQVKLLVTYHDLMLTYDADTSSSSIASFDSTHKDCDWSN